jgi:hypothetical protein
VEGFFIIGINLNHLITRNKILPLSAGSNVSRGEQIDKVNVTDNKIPLQSEIRFVVIVVLDQTFVQIAHRSPPFMLGGGPNSQIKNLFLSPLLNKNCHQTVTGTIRQ